MEEIIMQQCVLFIYLDKLVMIKQRLFLKHNYITSFYSYKLYKG